MKDEFDKRFGELLSDGQRLLSSLPRDEYGPEFWIPKGRISEYQRWLGSVTNLISLIDQSNGTFVAECKRIMQDQEIQKGIPSRIVQKMYGLLAASQDEWQRGLLRKVEYIVVAEAFDDFLDYASSYHKGNKKIESSVLGSAVLEDTVKRIARKNGIEAKGKSLELLIDDLLKAGIFTPVKAKRVKGFGSVRNHALHAEWDEFDIRDVGELISGVRELIDDFL
jgi:hypothetical protein